METPSNEFIGVVVAFLTYLFKDTAIKMIKESRFYIKREIMKIISDRDLHELRTLFGSYAVILLHNGTSIANKQYKKATTIFSHNFSEMVFNNEPIVKNDLLYFMVYEQKDMQDNTYIYACDNILLVLKKDVDLEKLKETRIFVILERLCKTSY